MSADVRLLTETIDFLHARIELLQKDNEMLAATVAFRNMGIGADSAILFAPTDDMRFTVQAALQRIELSNMKIGGFVLESTADAKYAGLVCVVYRGKTRTIFQPFMDNFMDPEE
jgi:hypothetical protein